MERAKQGDVRAFEELYQDNVGRIYAVCLRMVGERGRAEDLVQDVFLKAWRRLDSFRGDSAFSSWLHRLAVNLVLDHLKSEARKFGRVDLFEEPPEPLADRKPAPAPHHRVDLEAAIATLPDGARAVFVLHDVEGYRHREIAETMGITQGTSKAQLHRARRLLMEVLKDNGSPDDQTAA